MIFIKKHLAFALILLSLIYISSCSDSGSTEPEDNNNNSDDPARFSTIQEQVFDKSCAFTGCHAGTTPAAGLDLASGNSYSGLVNVTAKLNSNFKRVEPGNSSNSFLIKMLRNTGDGTRQMPPSGKLDESLLEYVETWIDEGAENN